MRDEIIRIATSPAEARQLADAMQTLGFQRITFTACGSWRTRAGTARWCGMGRPLYEMKTKWCRVKWNGRAVWMRPDTGFGSSPSVRRIERGEIRVTGAQIGD